MRRVVVDDAKDAATVELASLDVLVNHGSGPAEDGAEESA